MRALIYSIIVASIISLAQAAKCYYPDGKTEEPNHVPCNSTISDSACCDPKDACSQSGICLGSSGFNYRGSCTDQSWKSSNCPSQCRNDPLSNNNAYDKSTSLFPCNNAGQTSKDFCCQSSGNCCSKNFTYGSTGTSFAVGMDQMQQQLSQANSSTATVTVTAVTASATNSPKGSGNVGASIGAAIGVPFAVIAFGMIGFLFWRQKKKHELAEQAAVAEDTRARRAREDNERAEKDRLKKEEEAMFDEEEPVYDQSSERKLLIPRRPIPVARGASKASSTAKPPVRGASRVTGTSAGPLRLPATYVPYSPDRYRPNPEHSDLGDLY